MGKSVWGMILLALVLVLPGCSRTEPEPEEDWALTGTFDVVSTAQDGRTVTYTMRGVEGKYGFIDDPFVAGQGNKYMWHFWDESGKYGGKKLQVEATNREGKTVSVFEGGLGGPNNTATQHTPSTMMLPSAGRWRMTVRVGGEVVGHIVVDVKAPG
ncbi:MAG TPA: hypothetical protein VD973_04520 [Symbiobacteriaceae bacterium]|nr:hypothetical protein [Symbiobacteriaceae bacterium]